LEDRNRFSNAYFGLNAVSRIQFGIELNVF